MNMVTNITIFFGNEKKMINIFCYLSANYLAFFIFLVRNYGNYGLYTKGNIRKNNDFS